MKKILGISLVAVLAVSPLMARAEIPAGETGLAAGATGVNVAAKGANYAAKTISDADRAATASAAYVKGAYNDAISAVNKVAADAASATSSGITSAINGLNATVSQAAGDDGLALQVVEENGKLISVTGSIAANKYDAYGAATAAQTAAEATAAADATTKANAAEQNAKAYADTLAGNYDAAGSAATAEQNAKDYADSLASNYDAAGAAATAKSEAISAAATDATTKANAAETAAKSYADSLITDLGNVATQEGVENTIETASITATVASQNVTGYVPVMVNWGDSTANNTSAVALAGGATAGGSISNVQINATYAEPAQQPAQPANP